MPYYGRGRYYQGPRLSGLRLAARGASLASSAAARIQSYWRRRRGTTSGGRFAMPNVPAPGRIVKCSTTRQRVVRVEYPKQIGTKYLDQLPASSTVDASSPYVFGLVAGLAQGTNESQRVGNNIAIHEFEIALKLINGLVGATGSDYTQDETYKMLIVCYNVGTSNTDPGVAALLNNDVSGFVSPTSFKNVPNLDDFTILAEETIRVNSDQGVLNSRTAVKTQTYCVRMPKPLLQRYNGAAATSIVSNPVFLYILNDTAHTGTGAVNSSVSLSIRTIYTDSM